MATAAECLTHPGAVGEKGAVRRAVMVGLASLIFVVVAACGEPEPVGPPVFDAYPPMEVEVLRPYSVTFTTSVGRIRFLMLPQEAPLAVNSFIFLINEGYYDGLAFHRIVPGLFAESGDATGTGTGNAGYTFEIESPQRPYARGLIALANDGTPNSNGSRFLFILGNLAGSAEAPHEYTIFGHIRETHAVSQATLDKIEAAEEEVTILSTVATPLGRPWTGLQRAEEEVTILSTVATEGCLPSGGPFQCS